jgi:hypothetical protein
MNGRINDFERRVRSQNGEDGIVKELLFRIGVTERFVVEFGVESGIECNAAHWLLDYGWRGLLIEGDVHFAAAAAARYTGLPVAIHQALVTAENIVPIFQQHRVPLAPDVLSIDIDGNDYWLWEALGSYRPRLVVIEYNAAYAPPNRWVMAYNPSHVWGRDTYYGASLSSLAELGRRLGYALLATDRNGVNAFFVRRDLLASSGFPERSAAEAYHPLFVRHPPGDGPFVTV